MLKELLLLALMALCTSKGLHITGKTADLDFLHKQKKLYELLFFVKQNIFTDMEFHKIGRDYNIESNIDLYDDKLNVQDFLHLHKSGVLSRNAIFSPYYEEHREEVKIVFKLFFSAKDFQTFYKTACWARLHLNDGVFTSAFTTAVFYRPDCKHMKLPAPYEIYPNLFFDNNVIQRARDIKMMHGVRPTNVDNGDSYVIHANYSGNLVRPYLDDYKLDYFMEDVGLNAYYYYVRQVMPFWFSVKNFEIPAQFRGQFYYFKHKQLLNRYYLERISNDLGDIEDFDWNKPFYPGFHSILTYNNGMVIPQRSRYTAVPFYKYKHLKDIDVLEKRIMDAVDLGFVHDKDGKQVNIYTPEGLSILANLIEGNVDSCNRRFYGMYDALTRDILGFNFDYKNKNKVVPSALQCYSTSVRDPAFYRLTKRIMGYFFRYKKNVPHHTQDELIFPGVRFESVNVDKLVTYFDNCDTVINNALTVESFQEGMRFRVKARRYCLNHKPFTYRFTVNSDKETRAVLKIFLGPAFDNIRGNDVSQLREFYKYFFEMDHFEVTLRQGTNTIERHSSDSVFTMPDLVSSDTFYKQLERAMSGSAPFTYVEKFFTLPERLVLPKGKPEGMRFKMFFYLSKLDGSNVRSVELPIFGKLTMDEKPLDFPLDKPMHPWKFFTPNMFMKDVYIYHIPGNTVNENRVTENTITENWMNENWVNEDRLNGDTVNKNWLKEHRVNEDTINENWLKENRMKDTMDENTMNL
ncbi:arylphorin subunit alpha [Camponotus floridanus]|uniref:arylphorin subunit alpha n=1 Tax=Camponotus floridanus TaxID=104421 RepID=UPI000DC6890F|nr:arylphorin subunit alpha [Camponotus floridanus]